jgi:hypothetical protein
MPSGFGGPRCGDIGSKARTAELPRPNSLAGHRVAYDTRQGWGAGQQTGSNPPT